jgi:hypothetical protein
VICPAGEDVFLAELKRLQGRFNNPGFAAKFTSLQAGREAQRKQVADLTRPFVDEDFPNLQLLPMWHGTKATLVDSILQTGFANLATTDSDFFGKGIYNKREAEYAYSFLCCFVAV